MTIQFDALRGQIPPELLRVLEANNAFIQPTPQLTAVKTADYSALLGETVLVNPTGGAFAVTLPPLTGSGRDVTVANVSASTTAVTLQGGLGQVLSTVGDINSGSHDLSVLDVSPFFIGQLITVAGAGDDGTDLVTTIAGSGLGTLTLTDAAGTTVNGADVTSIGRQYIDAATSYSMAAAWRTITVRDVGTIWKKIALI